MSVQSNVIVWKETKVDRLPGGAPLPNNDEIEIALIDAPIDFEWRGRDVKEFIHMWNRGLSLWDIARAWPNRNPDDLILLWLHALYKGWIEDRPIWGRRRR